MSFKRYDSISHNSEKVLDRFRSIVPTDEDWVALEKIHGANAGIYFDINNGTVKFASRNKILSDGSLKDFHNIHVLKPTLTNQIKELAKLLKLLNSDKHDKFIVYGELCGYDYPHPDVPKNPNSKRFQKHIFYSPDLLFIAYDICLDDKFLPFDKTFDLLKKAKFMVPDIVKRGTLDECLQVDVEILQTTVPSKLNLPKIKNNYAEGVVIRPINDYRCDYDRIIIKKKKSSFSEVMSRDSYNENVLKISEISEDNLPKEVADLYNDMKRYITLNRVHNVKSHGSETTYNRRTVKKLIGHVVRDILREYKRDNDIDLPKKKELKKAMIMMLNDDVREFIIGNDSEIFG